MAWTCAYCHTSYARRKDHDESATSDKCKKQALEEAISTHETLKKERDALEINTGQLDKQLNRAWAKVRRLQGW